MNLPTLREVESDLSRILRDDGALAAVSVDLGALARIERSFGEASYQALMDQISPLLDELRHRLREDDILAREERGMDRLLLFVTRRRSGTIFKFGDLRNVAERLESFLAGRIARLALPYLRERAAVSVGYGFVVFSPLESPERQVARVLEECRSSSVLRRSIQERENREWLLEILHNREVWTAFQPIVEMETRRVMGHEGLSRGPRGSELEPPMQIFGLAARNGLVEELERACRKQAFVDWAGTGLTGRLFINTVPATVRDPSFLGRGVLDYVGAMSPRLVTLEINERQVIENLNLYREAMHAFLELGFTFAIDDVGAGYSGLETMANLGASYFKVDMGLVRHCHQKRVNRQVIRAILEMAKGVGATVIAEGIETADEATALLELGVRYGQGYHYGRPLDPRLIRPPTVADTSS
jgi:EAL domain-containing protein (putative c-di-GMP-specific phosphodiesterase class I)